MKLITAALVCLLVAGMWLQDVDSMSMHVPSSICCFRFVKRKIPSKHIKCHIDTGSSCSYPDSLIFVMKEGRRICVSKTDKWVEDTLKKIPHCTEQKCHQAPF